MLSYRQSKLQKNAIVCDVRQQMPYKDSERQKEYFAERYERIKQHAVDSLVRREIINPNMWKLYCKRVRHSARNNYSYPEDFTDNLIFDKMANGCDYCQDIATTIDRVDSSIGHITDNCVGSCWPCNNSKGNGDRDSFLRKAYYRVFNKYFDNEEDIWSDNITKPQINMFKIIATKQEIDFTLTNDQWDVLTKGDCVYCNRSRPIDKWNGVDRIIPVKGYTPENTVSCCDDCNLDKHIYDVKTTKARNEKIAFRMINKDITLAGVKKTLRNKGANQSSKKVCVYGKVYSSMTNASRYNNLKDHRIKNLIRSSNCPDDIFIISDEFYDFTIENKFENITKKMYLLFNRM